MAGSFSSASSTDTEQFKSTHTEQFVPGPLPPEYSYFLPNQPSCFFTTEGDLRCNTMDRYMWGWYDLSTQSKITIPKGCFPYGYPVTDKNKETPEQKN